MTDEEIAAQEAAEAAKEAEEAELLKKQKEEEEGEQDTEVSKEEYEKKLAELEAQKDKWKMRFQRNQKKIQTASGVDKESIKSVVKEMIGEETAKDRLLSKYPDSNDIMDKVEKVKTEKNLSRDEAYKLVKADELLDPNYQAQQRQGRTGIHGDFARVPAGDDELAKIIGKDPRIKEKK